MAKTTKVTSAPIKLSNKRLPKTNIDRLMQILRHKLQEKVYASCNYADKAVSEARGNYLKAATKKHGAAALASVKLNKYNYFEVVLTPKVKADLLRIEAPYKEVRTTNNDICPSNKLQQFNDAYQGLEDLELLLLTADSDQALAMYTSAEQQIEGIK